MGSSRVRAPTNAADGLRADVLLEIRDEHGALLTLGRFVATVTSAEDLPDESSVLPDAPRKQSSGLTPLALLAGLAVAAGRRRFAAERPCYVIRSAITS